MVETSIDGPVSDQLHKTVDDTRGPKMPRQLAVIALILGLGGTAAHNLLDSGNMHAGVFVAFGAVMLCLGLGTNILTKLLDHDDDNGTHEDMQPGVWRRVARSDTVIGIALCLTVAAIMWPFIESALVDGFSNISTTEQYAIVAVGLGLCGAVGSLFWEPR